MEEQQPYIQLGEHKYPITLQSFGFIPQPQEPIAHLKKVWSDWRKQKSVNVTYKAELTERGRAVMQDILAANGQCSVTIGYTGYTPITIASRFYRKRPRNTRVQRVQAKRKAMELDQEGKCCGLRTRKASLALRKAEQDFYEGRRSSVPETSEFEHWTARKQREDRRCVLRWRSLDEDEFGLYDFWYGW